MRRGSKRAHFCYGLEAHRRVQASIWRSCKVVFFERYNAGGCIGSDRNRSHRGHRVQCNLDPEGRAVVAYQHFLSSIKEAVAPKTESPDSQPTNSQQEYNCSFVVTEVGQMAQNRMNSGMPGLLLSYQLTNCHLHLLRV